MIPGYLKLGTQLTKCEKGEPNANSHLRTPRSYNILELVLDWIQFFSRSKQPMAGSNQDTHYKNTKFSMTQTPTQNQGRPARPFSYSSFAFLKPRLGRHLLPEAGGSSSSEIRQGSLGSLFCLYSVSIHLLLGSLCALLLWRLNVFFGCLW